MLKIAFATYQHEPGITDDDALVVNALRQHGLTVTAAVWDAPNVDWRGFDAVVLRSVWDYHLKPDLFEHWLRSCASDRTTLWNPPSAVLWNMNKRYLLDLAARGINIIPTEYLTAATQPSLRRVLALRGWDEAVAKPALAAGSHGAWRTSLTRALADQARFAEQVSAQDMLVQPYLSEIATSGEWSLVFFDSEYSHALRKRPAVGDFRVQEHLGGNTVLAQPGQALIDQAHAALTAPVSRCCMAGWTESSVKGNSSSWSWKSMNLFCFCGWRKGQDSGSRRR
jgi:hypothetical protein